MTRLDDNACNEHPKGCPEGSHRGHRYDGSQAAPTGIAVAEMIGDLQTKLCEAQEERDVAQETVVALSSVAQERDEARAERDAAIELGVEAYEWGEIGWEYRALVEILARDAEAKGALAERRLWMGLWAHKALECLAQGGVKLTVGAPNGENNEI